eukprot:1981946-Rhodomonas_salina.2
METIRNSPVTVRAVMVYAASHTDSEPNTPRRREPSVVLSRMPYSPERSSEPPEGRAPEASPSQPREVVGSHEGPVMVLDIDTYEC